MYNSSLSRATFGLEAKDVHASKGKSCGYYMRVVFFFSSLVQTLIIISLVLFLVYGQPEQSADEKRVQDLEQSSKQVNGDNKLLRSKVANLTDLLEKCQAGRTACERKLAETQKKLTQCETDKKKAEMTRPTPIQCPIQPPVITAPNIAGIKALEMKNQWLTTSLKQLEMNFTRTVKDLKSQVESTTQAREKLSLVAKEQEQLSLSLTKRLEIYTKKCKEDFTESLQGIHMVTGAFLEKIKNLTPADHTFLLSSKSQQEYLEKLSLRCTTLSKEVEEKFQVYLDKVGSQVSQLQSRSAELTVQNELLSEDLKHCRTA